MSLKVGNRFIFIISFCASVRKCACMQVCVVVCEYMRICVYMYVGVTVCECVCV